VVTASADKQIFFKRRGKTFFLLKRFFSERKDDFSASLRPSTFSKKEKDTGDI
jgi:hypothetical protein